MHALTAHPFTICSVPQNNGKNQLVFYVKQHGGLTGRLMSMAKKYPDVTIPVLMDGPYGGISAGRLEEFDKSLVIGGGAGAGLTLSMIEDYVRFSNDQKELNVVVATRDPGMRAWYLQALEDMAIRQSVQKPISGLSIFIHETHSSFSSENKQLEVEVNGDETKSQNVLSDEYNLSGSAAEISEVFGIQFFTGRPELPTIIHQVASQEGASVGVIVCGPSSMTHDVSTAASDVQGQILARKPGRARELWLHRENFS